MACLASRGSAVQFRFNAEEWSRLMPQQQAERCRSMVQESNALARSAKTPELQTVYYELALQWKKVANEIERAADQNSN
jgi:hypothetical protein